MTILKDTNNQMKSWQQWYKDYQNQKYRKAPYSFTLWQYINLSRPPITTSVAQRLATETYNKVMPPNTERFKIIEVSRMTITIIEDGIPNTIAIYRDTLAAREKLTDRQLIYTPDEPGHKREDRLHEGRKETISENIIDAQGEYAVDRIVCHMGEGDNIGYAMQWYSYTPADNTVQPLGPIPEHSITSYWRQVRKNDAVHQRHGRSHVRRRGKYQSNQHWRDARNVKDKIRKNVCKEAKE